MSIERPNIVMIAVDTLRADHLSCYGYRHNTSPTIDRLAGEGVLFENYIACGIPTQPAYTTVFTGQHPFEHGIAQHAATGASIPATTPWLPSVLAGHGYMTAAVDNLYDHQPWFGRGYNTYMNPRTWQHITAEDINASAIPWLRRRTDEKFFLFVHYWDPHTPYLPPEAYRNLFYDGDRNDPANKSFEQVKRQFVYPFFKKWNYDLLGDFTDIDYVVAQYDAEIRYVDDQLALLLRTIEESPLRDNTVVVIFSDHGESLTEHEMYFDHPGLYEANVHVPLIMKGPSELSGGVRVKGLADHRDVFSTILELAGIEDVYQGSGRSLMPLARNPASEGRPFTMLSECTWQAAEAIRTARWKLIHLIDKGLFRRPKRELFDLEKDPGETVNLYDEQPDLVAELELLFFRNREELLGGRPDPVKVQLQQGFPPRQWLENVLREEGTNWKEWAEEQKYI